MVWWQLSGMNESEWSSLPWRRVVSKEWKISSLKLWSKGRRQVQLLEKEWFDVVLNQIDMREYRREWLEEALDILESSNESNPN